MKRKGYNPEFDAPVTCVLGRRGSGKTTWTRREVKTSRRVVLFDPKKDYDARRFSSLVDLYDHLKKAGSGPVRASYCPDLVIGDDDADADEGDKKTFNLFCEVVYSFGNCLMVADELDRFTGPGPRIPRWFSILVNEGRHAKVSMIGISRRPAKIPKDFIENSHRLILFHMKGGAVNYLRPIIGKEDAEKLPKLPPLTYLEWSESENNQIKKL